jgi:hypothetical protein
MPNWWTGKQPHPARIGVSVAGAIWRTLRAGRIEVSESHIRRYLARHPLPPASSTFLMASYKRVSKTGIKNKQIYKLSSRQADHWLSTPPPEMLGMLVAQLRHIAETCVEALYRAAPRNCRLAKQSDKFCLPMGACLSQYAVEMGSRRRASNIQSLGHNSEALSGDQLGKNACFCWRQVEEIRKDSDPIGGTSPAINDEKARCGPVMIRKKRESLR